MIKYIPNIITSLRILLTVFFLLAFINGKFLLSLIYFSLVALSDFFDGYLAKKWNVCSKFGAMLDPLADKFTMLSSYLLFYLLNIIPLYITIIVIGRDILILFAVILCLFKRVNLKFSPLISSKINTTIQMIFIIFVLICKSFSINISLDIFMLVVCTSTIYSGIDYILKYKWLKNELDK